MREAQSRISSREFGELCALYTIEPWDLSRIEAQLAMIAAAVFAFWTGTPQSPQRFAPYLDIPEAGGGQSEEEAMNLMEAHRG